MKRVYQIFAIVVVLPLPANAVKGRYLEPSQAPESACEVVYVDGNGKIKGLCSGDVVSVDKFLLAAHCQDGNSLKPVIVCGDKNKTYHGVNAIRINPKYDGNFNQFDQALLQVSNKFSYKPASLPESETELATALKGKNCEVWGHGLDNENKAGKLHGISADFNGVDFGPGLIGVGGTSWPIQGDSGGGLYCKNKKGSRIRVGTVSRAEQGLSSIASLRASLDWTKENIKQTFPTGEVSGPQFKAASKTYDQDREETRNSSRGSDLQEGSRAEVLAALTQMAIKSCAGADNQSRLGGLFSSDVAKPISDEKAKDIATCFLSTDFWGADKQHSCLAAGENINGTATGLAMACSRALGVECSRNFLKAGVASHRSIQVISGGVHEFSGYGAQSNEVLVMPEARSLIKVSGHSKIFYLPGSGTHCLDSGHFEGCYPVGNRPDDVSGIFTGRKACAESQRLRKQYSDDSAAQ